MTVRSDAIAIIFGANVRKHRAILGWTVGELARRVGIARPIVSRTEGGSHSPNASTVLRYAKALDVPVAALVDGVDEAIGRMLAGDDPRDALRWGL